MNDLSDDDINRIADALAPKLVDTVRAKHHDFWIDPETHYKDHQIIRSLEPGEIYELKQLVTMFKTTKSLWFKAFLGMAIVGGFVMAAFSMGFHK